jgi:hypothetical protein
MARYGIISDLHKRPGKIEPALALLKDEGVDGLVLNGDVGEFRRTAYGRQQSMAQILETIAASGLETFVNTGNHELYFDFTSVLEDVCAGHSNIVDVTSDNRIVKKGYNLVFLPGADIGGVGRYALTNDGKVKTGVYIETADEEKPLIPFESMEQYEKLKADGKALGVTYFTNMWDLRKLVPKPENTVVFCHVPRRFDDAEAGVDRGKFGVVLMNFTLDGWMPCRAGSVLPCPPALGVESAGYPVRVIEANRGNPDLSEVFEDVGVRFAISGHFHETAGRATDKAGNSLYDGLWEKELFWNASHMDRGMFGILDIADEKVMFRNLRV